MIQSDGLKVEKKGLYMNELNDIQKEAVLHEDGSMMVLAGPGSGKTTVILARVSELLGKFPNKMILVVTYTKAVALEMKERFQGTGNVVFSTFHGLFFKVISQSYGYTMHHIMKEFEKKQCLMPCFAQIEEEINDQEQLLESFFSQYSYLKNMMLELEFFEPAEMGKQTFDIFYEAYETHKKKYQKIDFDDMLEITYQLFKTNEAILQYWRDAYDFVMIDEFQDINQIQYELMKMMVLPKNNLFVVGDDDQSIYGFRGSNPDFLLDFEKDFQGAKKLTLKENYRSDETIVALSQKLIRHNQKRFEKEMKAGKTFEEKDIVITWKLKEHITQEVQDVCNEIQELLNQGIPHKEIAVIYRMNVQGNAFARELHQRGIPYVIRDQGRNIYTHWIVRDLIDYIKLAHDTSYNEGLISLLNKPKRFVSNDLIKKIKATNGSCYDYLFSMRGIPDWQREKFDDLKVDLTRLKKKRKPYEVLKYIRQVIGYDEYLKEYASYRKVNLQNLLDIIHDITEMSKTTNTIEEFFKLIEDMAKESEEFRNTKKFQAKLKGDGIYLTTMHSAKGLEFEAVFLPNLIERIVPSNRNHDIEEERRLFYVALTRAKRKLYLSFLQEYHDEDAEPSPFLAELFQTEQQEEDIEAIWEKWEEEREVDIITKMKNLIKSL